MALLKVICWALIFIIRIRFPPGKSLATILEYLFSEYCTDAVPEKLAPVTNSQRNEALNVL